MLCDVGHNCAILLLLGYASIARPYHNRCPVESESTHAFFAHRLRVKSNWKSSERKFVIIYSMSCSLVSRNAGSPTAVESFVSRHSLDSRHIYIMA